MHSINNARLWSAVRSHWHTVGFAIDWSSRNFSFWPLRIALPFELATEHHPKTGFDILTRRPTTSSTSTSVPLSKTLINLLVVAISSRTTAPVSFTTMHHINVVFDYMWEMHGGQETTTCHNLRFVSQQLLGFRQLLGFILDRIHADSKKHCWDSCEFQQS